MMAAQHARHQRREVFYRGRVQGVGFRYTTRHLADQFDVHGYVQNLPDGRVLVVAEGDSREIDLFLGAIMAHLGHYIVDVETRVMPASGEFRGFGIHL
jgi:acylphosphatase